ncbi:MAG: hypothetical protein IKG42_06740 [Clostridia bacterium]|nr:hypothetical protein [Clostridia bacterium]
MYYDEEKEKAESLLVTVIVANIVFFIGIVLVLAGVPGFADTSVSEASIQTTIQAE